MNLNLREQLLVINALYMMEGEDLPYEVELELGGIPDVDEVHTLMEKIASAPVSVSLSDLPLGEAIADKRWEIWQDDPWEHTVGESEDDSVMGSWIGYDLVQEIDAWLTTQGINYAVFTKE